MSVADQITRIQTARNTIRTKLAALGLVPGTAVLCPYRSPDGRVTAVACRGTVLALRSRDLHGIRVLMG